MKYIPEFQQRQFVVPNLADQIGLRILNDTVSPQLHVLSVLCPAFGPDPLNSRLSAKRPVQVVLLTR